MTDTNKRANGQYFTRRNLFDTPCFRGWAQCAGLPKATLIEPFAGGGDLITMLKTLGLSGKVEAYDIAPAAAGIQERDTLQDFPQGGVVVTNPPWLARNSATRRGLPYPKTQYDDLYKHALAVCLENTDYVAAIIPASFLVAGVFRSRLCAVDMANMPVFQDTENPACLALFNPQETANVAIYNGGELVGDLVELEQRLPTPTAKIPMRFNDPCGRLGFVAFDNTREESIHFCKGQELSGYQIGTTSRMITRIEGEFGKLDVLINRLNARISEFRRDTGDVFLTPFKGLRKDKPCLRRRMDFRLARNFINASL